MRSFAWFFGTLLAAGLLAAALAYPAYELTSQLASWPFHRVTSRIAMLLAAGGLVWLCRRLDIKTLRAVGYGLPWRRFLAVSLIWGVIGIATASLGAAFLVLDGLRIVADPATAFAARSIAHLMVLGLSSGIAVALIEETVMRGAMHTAIARESGEWAAVLLVAPLFAVLHFTARARIPAHELDWLSGLKLLGLSFAPLGSPLLVQGAVCAWLAVSVVLSLTRLLSGNIAAAIGLHAGWVMVLRILAEITTPTAAAAGSVWVSKIDGLLGLWVVPWAAAIGAAVWLTRRRWLAYAGLPGRAGGSDCGGTVNGASRSSR